MALRLIKRWNTLRLELKHKKPSTAKVITVERTKEEWDEIMKQARLNNPEIHTKLRPLKKRHRKHV